MNQYETVLIVNGQPVKPQGLIQSFKKTLSGFGAILLLLIGCAIAFVLSSPELRSQIFFLAPAQAVVANEIDSISPDYPVASGNTEANAPVPQGSKNLMPVSFNSIDINKPLSLGQRQITAYLAKLYKVSPEAVESIVRLAYKVGREEKVEPTLLLAIVGIESSFNPFAASSVGAHGLMQIMPKIHKDKFETLSPGEWSPLNPEINMRVGAKIVRDYTRRAGSVDAGLRWYVGAAIHGNDGGYPDKVLGLKSRIDSVYQHGHVVTLPAKPKTVAVVAEKAADHVLEVASPAEKDKPAVATEKLADSES